MSNAFSFPEVRIVDASAGSGKTFALAKRYVQLLLALYAHPTDDIPSKSILAITFTNKAAQEMKARILFFLKKMALQQLSPEEQDVLIKPLGLSVDEACSLAFRIMKDIIHYYHFFQVQTIDSFINAILSSSAWKMKLSANFQIRHDADQYIAQALDRLIDRCASDPAVYQVFAEFLHHYLFIENRSGWFPKKDIWQLMISLFGQSNTFGKSLFGYDLGEYNLGAAKGKFLHQLKTLQDSLPEGTDARFRNALSKFLDKHPQSFDLDDLSNYFAREHMPVRKGVGVPPDVQRMWQGIHKSCRDMCEAEGFSIFNAYVAVYHAMQQELNALTQKDNVLFLEELNAKAQTLYEDLSVEELYFRLSTRLKHFLIDEFQDTSQLQWHNLRLMVEDALDSSGSLFYVGDPKQAIYSFRGGDPNLFANVQQEFNHVPIHVEPLQVNYRSLSHIVQWNNEIFSQDNLQRFVEAKTEYDESKKDDSMLLEQDDIDHVKHVFRFAKQDIRPGHDGGYVCVEPLEGRIKEDRLDAAYEKVTTLLNDVLQRYPYGDIAILVRNNNDVAQVTSWLLDQNIPVQSERTLHVQSHSRIQEFISFLTFLNSPIDNYHFAQFITGDVFAKATKTPASVYHQFIFQHRDDLQKGKNFCLYKAFQKAMPDIWEQYIGDFFKHVGLYPMYEMVVHILQTWNVLADWPDDHVFWMHLLELIKQTEEEVIDLGHFLDYFDNLPADKQFVHLTHPNAVQVLTIHKAKGLEFPVVIIPFLGMNVQVGSKTDHHQSYIVNQGEEEMSLLRLKKKYVNFSSRLKAIYNHEYKKALLSELNNVYVALTRASCELYAFIPEKIGNSYNLVNFLIPENLWQARGQSLSSDPKDQDIKDNNDQAWCLPVNNFCEWMPYLQEEFHDAVE